MSLKTSILRSYVGPLVCALLPSSRVTALSDVPRARKRRLLSNDRFDVYLRQVALKLATLCLLACASLTSAETLVVDESNHRGWTFFANPAVTVAGEAPVVGISDHAGGAASLNFSLNAGQDKSSRNARLLKSDFPAAGLTDITTLRDLSSISWQVHHSDPGNYPKFVVWVEVPITDEGTVREAIYFRPQNQAVKRNQWDLVTVDLVNSKFTNNGVTTDGEKSTGTFAEWREVIGNYDIHEIGIQYNNGNKSYVSYIDYIEINGTTFNFEASPPLPPSAPTDLVATPGDGQLTIAFTQSDDNGTAITDYQYKRDDGSWTAAGTTGSSITIPDLTNGKDYVVRLRAISAAGEGEEAQILAAPRGTSDPVTLLVTSDNPRGFRLAGFTSDYVQERNNVGIDDGFGGASINASLEGQGADQWGLFLDPAQFKGGPISQAGRKAERLQDLTSLSYRVWHDGEGYYPKLGFRMERGAPSDDGKTIAQLDLKMNQMPSLTPGWNTVEINFAQSPFAISYLSEGETSETKTLSEWIALYGDRRIKLFRWQTGRSDRETTQETYVDYIEVNGVTYDFEGTLPEVPDECSSADWAVVEASDASKQAFRCVADEAVYEYADFHVLTTTGNGADICQSSLPINVNNQDNDALFCSESEGVLRAIFDWDNRSIEPGGMGIRLTWLETVSQIGSRKKGGTACGSADETVAGRCANQLAHGQRAFVDMAGAGGPAIAALNTSNLQSFRVMFGSAAQFNEDISRWDTRAIKDMGYMFHQATQFNRDIGGWETGSATQMDHMFQLAKAFNQDLPWDTSGVKNMEEMFRGASVFNGDVSLWQTGLVTNMNYMFREATAFNQNIGTWDTANVTGMFNMFHKAKAFNQNIGQWDTSKVTTMRRMFDRAESFNQDLSKWDIENVTAKSDFDALATAWCGKTFPNNGRPIGITPQLSDGCLSDSVSECSAVSVDEWALASSDPEWICRIDGEPYEYADFHILTTIDSQPDVCSTPANYLPTDDNNGAGLFCQQRGSDVRALFDWGWGQNDQRCSVAVLNGNEQYSCLYWLKSASQFGSRAALPGDIPGLTVAGRVPNQLADGKYAFARFAGEGGSGFQSLDTSNLTSLSYAFARAKSFKEDISAWDTAKVTALNRAFWLSDFDLPIPTNGSAWDVSQVSNFDGAFAQSAFNQDLSSWDVGNARLLSDMFKNNKRFNQNLSAWADNLTQLATLKNMFRNASAFNNGLTDASDQPLNWGDTPKLTNMDYVFADAKSFNQQIFADGASTAKVERMSGAFKGASAFNQDLSGWNVDGVTNHSSFDEGADNWCGFGFNNRGRPIGFSPTEAVGCLNVVLQAPESGSVGDEFDYVVQYYNPSTTPFDDGVLTLDIPSGISIKDAGEGAVSDSNNGSQITWTNIEVPAGSSANGGGGELKVGATIGAGVTDGTELIASATLTDGAATSINDVAGTLVSAKSVLRPTIDEAAETVLPGEVIEYSLSVENVGTSPTEGGDMTLTWEGDVPFTIEGKGGATCNGASCRWVGELAPDDPRSQTVKIRIGIDAAANATLTATLSASASNELDAANSKASVTTEILALPLPELNIDVATHPQSVIDLGAQFTAFVDLSNTGSGPAGSTTVTLDIGSATYVGPAVGDEGVYANNVVTWTISNLESSEFKGLAVTLKAPAAVGAVLLESEVSTTTAAGDVIPDRASRPLRATGAAVLDLQLSLNPEDQLLPGDVLDMDFGFQNIGNSPAADAVLATDTPVDTTLLAWPVYATCAGNDCSEGYVGAISLNLGTVLAKENALARLSVVVNETAEEQTLSVAGSLTGTNAAGDALVPQAAAASVRVAAITEDVLAVSQRADRQTVAPGQVVVYEITYQNLSSEAVTNVTLTDVLPSETRLLNQTGGTVTIDPVTQETTWQLTTDLMAPLETGKVLLQVEVAGNAVTGTSLNNSVSLSTADSTVWADPAEVKVVASAAVLESSISNPASTAPGDSFTYALRFANTGTLAASNTTLQLQVEDGVTVTDCDDCSKTEGGRLSWSLSSVAAGTDQTKQITVLVDPSVAANSELHAISYIGDSQSAGAVGVSGKLSAQQQRRRGSASATQAASAAERAGPLGVSTIRVGEKASPALGGLKLVAPTQVVAGDPVAVTVSFGNTGGAPATGVTLTSTVPANSTLTSVEGGSCSANPCIAGETITWNVGEVAAESTREVSYSLTADSDAAGSVIGHRVVLNSAESREASASANTDVVAEKLSVSIAVKDAAGNDAEGSIVSVGDTLTYELTLLNNSPTGRSGITVVNSVPPAVAACGQACIGGDGKGAAIDAEAGTLTWSNFALDAGAEVTLNYQVTIPSGLANNTPLINSVSVSTATRFDDSVQSTVTVASQAELVLSMTAPGVLQDGAQGGVTLSYQNTGTAATAATLRYVLPSNATMIDSANATVSGSAYTWNLGDVAVQGVGSREVTIEVSGAADSRLLHTASVTGTDTSDTAEATTVIGLREELALSLTAPGSVNTGAGFTASLTAQNTGNAAATATELSLTLPAGFTASALDGGTLDSALDTQVVRWTVDLAAEASVTLSPTVTAPSAAGKAVLSAGLKATSGKTQSASADVQVTMAASAIITAAAQFSVPEAKAGDSVTLTAGPVNIGGAASGAIANSITLAAGLSPTGYAGLQWNSTTRVLSWETRSLASRGSDLKAITLQVADAGALTASLTSNDASGTASIVRTFPEEVTITPENPDSSCQVSDQPVVKAAPTPPEGVTLAFANTVGFTVVDCDRNPNNTYPETMVVTIDVDKAIPEGAKLYKITDAGVWKVIENAVIGGQNVTYSITDDGDLDLSETPGILRDPVALAFPKDEAPPPEVKPVIPVPLPIWLLAALMGSVGWLGYRRLNSI